VGVNVAVFVVGFLQVSKYASDTVLISQTEQPLIFEQRSKEALQLTPKTGNDVHLFLSHTQGTGQDLTTTVNLSLKLAARDIVLFQDIDFENFKDVHSLSTFCTQADVFLLILTEGVFNSYYVVVKELMARMAKDMEVVLLLDTDTRHGGGTLDGFMKEARESAVVEKHCRTMLEITPAEFCRKLSKCKVIVWHRKKAFRLVSVLKLLEAVKAKQLEWEGVRPLPALDIAPVAKEFAAHLGFSAHNAKSKQLRQHLQAKYPQLVTKLVHDTAGFSKCEKAIVVLADGVFDCIEYNDAVCAAIDSRTNMNLVLLHVSPAAGGVPFSTIMEQCPETLKDKGIFDTLASELVDDDDDYLSIVLREIADRFALQEVNDSMTQEEVVRGTDPAGTEGIEMGSLGVFGTQFGDAQQVTQSPDSITRCDQAQAYGLP